MTGSGDALESVFREEHGLVLASLAKTFGDLDLAEEALADAVASAVETWPDRGVPDSPAAWLLVVARRKGIDRLRRARAHDARLVEIARMTPQQEPPTDVEIHDERLHLIFACCHPALSPEARVALTLKSLGGLSTAEVARAFLTSEPTMFQRLTRAKAKVRLAGIPIAMPDEKDLPERLESVLAVIYLIFNAGYSPIGGPSIANPELCLEAIRLGRILTTLMPEESEAWALVALCLLTEARRKARVDAVGKLVLLEDQDRAAWDRNAIRDGLAVLDVAHRLGGDGPYLLQAEIAAVHASADTWADTDWDSIVAAYTRLFDQKPSPVVYLNLAAAIAMRDGPEPGLAMMESVEEPLQHYQSFHASRAELLLRSGRPDEAAAEFSKALDFPLNDVERQHLEGRLVEASR